MIEEGEFSKFGITSSAINLSAPGERETQSALAIATWLKTEVKLNGRTNYIRGSRNRRTALAFYLANGELRVKDKLEVLE